ncbi:MAG: hypothetical protein V1929_09395 [bacterium]
MSAEQNSAWSAPGWTCPSCGAAMPDSAVICITCGYDKRTGRKVNEPPPSRTGYRIASTVIAIGIALGVRSCFSRTPPVPPAPPHAAEAERPAPAGANPTWNAAPVAAAVPTGSAVAVVPAPAVTSAPAIDTNERALAERAAREQEKKETFRVQLDAKYPLFAPGETVALRMTNAMIRRGMFKGNTPGALVMVEAAADEVTVPFAELDLATRLRCDAEYRARYLDYAVERAMKTSK